MNINEKFEELYEETKLEEHCGECEMGITEEVSVKEFDALKKGDTVTIEFKSPMSTGKATFKVTAKNVVGKARIEKATLKDVKRPSGVKFFLYKRGNKVSLAQGDMAASVVSFMKEDKDLEKMVKELEGASKMHLGQSKRIAKYLETIKDKKEEVEIKEYGKIYARKGSDYELYHKTFSGAMQHAYAHAKKKGFTVDPDEIDNKVATGPKKPSKGKTNRYILGTDKKKKLHVQVANLDNKRFELNMYIEETEIDEKSMLPRPGAGAYKTPEQRKKDAETKKRLKMFKGLRDKKESVEEKLVGGQKKLDKDKDGDLDAKDFAMLRKSKKKSESKLYSHVKNMMKKEYANVKKMKKMNSEDYLDMWLNDEIELSEDFNQEVIELTQLHDEGKLTDAELEESILKKVGGAVARGAGRAAMGAGKLAGRAAKAGAKAAGKAAVGAGKAAGKAAYQGTKDAVKAGAKRMTRAGRIDAAKKKADKFKRKSAERKELKKVKRDAATAQRRYKAGK